MSYYKHDQSSSTIGIRVMCAIVFVVFSFCWLYYFQSDVLMMTQHVLSGGLTNYNRIVGAVIVTFSLMLLQLLVYKILHLKKKSHTLTYLPSFLFLGLLSDFVQKGYDGVTYGFSWWLPILILAIWMFVVYVSRMIQGVETDEQFNIFSRTIWVNMLGMAIMIIGVAWLANTNAVFHYRMAMERHLLEGDDRAALEIGKKSLESDEHLLMLRMYALGRTGGLGDHLFEYPVTGSSAQILPTDSSASVMMYPVDSLYRFIGARPVGKMPPLRYLELVSKKDSLSPKVVHDYILCGYLIDRQLDRFANAFRSYYEINDSLHNNSLPKHYREALTLYTHMKAHPVIVYHNAVMDEDYDNLQELEKQYPDKTERKGKVEEQYRGTYWYYYRYQ